MKNNHKEYKTPLVKFKINSPNEQNYTLSVGNKTFKFNNADRGTFEKFLSQFQFLTDQSPVTKTPNDYKALLCDIHNGKKPSAYLYQNRADRMYKYLRKKGNPYLKESVKERGMQDHGIMNRNGELLSSNGWDSNISNALLFKDWKSASKQRDKLTSSLNSGLEIVQISNGMIVESTISANILPSIKITTEPKDKKKNVLFGGMYKLNERLFACNSAEEVKQLFIS